MLRAAPEMRRLCEFNDYASDGEALPLLLIPEHVLLPHEGIPCTLGDAASVRLWTDLLRSGRLLLAVVAYRRAEGHPSPASTPGSLGVVARIRREDADPRGDGSWNVVVIGLRSMAVESVLQDAPYPIVVIRQVMKLSAGDAAAPSELSDRLHSVVRCFLQSRRHMSPDLVDRYLVDAADSPCLPYHLAAGMNPTFEDRYGLLRAVTSTDLVARVLAIARRVGLEDSSVSG